MHLLLNLANVSLIVLALIFRLASTPTANLSYLVLAGYALIGRAQAIQALALSWLFTMLNPGLAAEATASSTGRYAVLLGAAASVFVRSRTFHSGGIHVRSVTMNTVLLGLFLVVHSLFFSPIMDVSVLKAVSWTLAMSTLIAAWLGLSPDERDRLSQQIFVGLIVLMLVSLPLLGLPVGRLRNESGFQGILNHPQAFGPTMALLGAWAMSRMLGHKPPPWSMVALTGSCLVLVVLSEARTAGLALVLGVGIAAITAPNLAGRSVYEVLPGLRSKRVYFVGMIALAGTLLAGPMLADQIDHFLSKSGRSQASDLIDAYQNSRGRKMDEMWDNIKITSWQGSGFGIASVPAEMDIGRDPILNLPVSASVEKGVLPLAVLEEVGIIGFVVVAAWIWTLLRRSSTGGIVPVTVAFTALLLNMGEATLFSPGGVGLLSLVLLGWAFACGQAASTRR